MDARERLLEAALALIGEAGGFATRAVCERAGVTAPTLYHHFGDADGLLNAAVLRGFDRFLARKLARPPAADPAEDLLAGWDDYVAFAREHPRLYAAMFARLLQGVPIPAAEAGRANLAGKLATLAKAGRLAMPVPAAADLVWASAHAAAMLLLSGSPEPGVVAALRASAASVLHPSERS